MQHDGTVKIVGVGLNKTGTKTLKFYLRHWGFRHQSYDLDAFNRFRAGRVAELLASMRAYDSFEDWPWPLLYREIDDYFPDARFILTTRRNADVWYRSLCNMAVRMGPFKDFERHIYGHAMPQGHRAEHLRYYCEHNRAVEAHFRDRPGKLLRVCWETGDDASSLAEFLGLQGDIPPPRQVNRSSRSVYTGDNLYLAQANRLLYQGWWHTRRRIKGLLRGAR